MRLFSASSFVTAKVSFTIYNLCNVGMGRFHLLSNDRSHFFDGFLMAFKLGLDYIFTSHISLIILEPGAKAYNWHVLLH